MAIKGKSKGRTAKAVTRGPKPVYQPVKKPLLAKREFWLVIGTILGVALVVGLVAGFIIERNSTEQDDLEQRMRAAVNTYRGELEPILATIGQARAPSGFDAFTEFGTAVADLDAETPQAPVDPKALEQTAADTLASAKTLEALQEIDDTALISGKGFSEDFVVYLINSKGTSSGRWSYREAAHLLELAAGAEGATRAELAVRTQGILNAANEIFAAGTPITSRRRPRRGVHAVGAGAGAPGADRHFMTDGLLLLHAWPIDAGCGSGSSPPSRGTSPWPHPTCRASGTPRRPATS